MKRKVIVEIEYPDNFDGVWDHDKSGMQTFSDTFNLYAIAHCADALYMAIKRCRSEGKITSDAQQADPYYQYVMVKNEVVNSAVIYGFVDDDGNVMHFDRDKYEFVNESSTDSTVKELLDIIAAYNETDETACGGNWEEDNAMFLDIARRGVAALRKHGRVPSNEFEADNE